MNLFTNISKIASAALLLLFTLSITPKSVLHEALANHTDITSCGDSKIAGPCIHKQGYSCQQSDLVSPSPYIALAIDCKPYVSFECFDKNISYSYSLVQYHQQPFEERGPPRHV